MAGTDNATPGLATRRPRGGIVLTVGLLSVLVAVIVAGVWALPGALPGFEIPPSSRQLEVALAAAAAVSVAVWAFSRARARPVAIVGLVLAVAANGAAGYVVSELQDTPATLVGRDATTGRLVWQRRLPYAGLSLSSSNGKATVTERRGQGCSPVLVDQQVDPATGRLSHTRRRPDGYRIGDIVVDDAITEFRYSYNGVESGVQATHRATKQVLWRRFGPVTSGPALTERPVIGDGVVMLVVGGGFLG